MKRSSGDLKDKVTRTRGKTALLKLPGVRFDEDYSFYLVDPARQPDYSSIMDIEMGMGPILFACATGKTSREYGQGMGSIENINPEVD